MSGFAWLDKLMTWLGKWVPRLVLVTARCRAIVFRRGGAVSEHGPGLLVYWPLVHELCVVSMQLRTMELAAQLHGTEVVQPDKGSVLIGLEVRAALRARLKPHGVVIEAVQVAQRGWALPLKNLNDWATHEARELAGVLK